MVESRLRDFSWDRPDASQTMLKAVEEFATECSIVKVYCSEMLDYVVDEAVQIHGGYGFHQDYAVERAYRDSRINRIFEGTNEINRLLIPGMLLKRDSRGQLSLLSAASAAFEGVDAGRKDDAEDRLVASAKRIALVCLAAAHRKYPAGLDRHQEILMYIADMIIDSYVMESALLRSRKMADRGRNAAAREITAVLLRDAMARIEVAARNVLAAAPASGAPELVRRLATYDPVDSIALRRQISRRLLQAERYIV
jgi:hypothetical protein